jgi:hypothetical protein
VLPTISLPSLVLKSGGLLFSLRRFKFDW